MFFDVSPAGSQEKGRKSGLFCVDKPPNMSLRAVGSDPLIAPPLTARFTEASGDASLRRGNPFFSKMLKNQDFQDTDSHTSDVGHSLQVLGDEGALELVRAFGRFGMTENQLCLQSETQARRACVFCAEKFSFPQIPIDKRHALG